MKSKLLIVTTVPETLATILRGQPSFLSESFDIELATSPGRYFSEVANGEKVVVHAVRMHRGISPFKDIVSVMSMVILLIRIRPTLVHSYTPKAGLITMLSAWFCRVPVRIHTFTGLIFPTEYGIKQKILIMIDRLICACATKVIPEGNGVKSDLASYRITKKELNVIGSGNIAGVDLEYFSRDQPDVIAASNLLRGRISLPDDAFVFSFVGRLNSDKGISELLRAFSALPDNAFLILVGAIDESAPIDGGCLEIVKQHPRVHALGFQADIRPALVLSDVLVLPSYREGFPNSILQAGAMYLPVIASDVNGCNEVIENGFNGWLVPPRLVEPLRAAMTAAMSEPAASLQEMGARAHERVSARFEQKQHWQRMLDFYCNCLSGVDRAI